MKLTYKKYAAISAVVLGVAAVGTAQAVQIGSPTTVPVNATVENTITVTVAAPLDFGTIGAIRDTVDTATLSVLPDDTATPDPGTGYGGADPAAIVYDPSDAPTAADIELSLAFENTEIYVTYQTCVDPVLAGENFVLGGIVDDLATPGSYDCVAAPIIGHGTTDGSGDLDFSIGGSITTTTGAATAYADGDYVGSFDIVLSY